MVFGGVQGVEQQGKSQQFSIHQSKGPSCQRWPEPRQVSTSQEKHITECYVTMIDKAASHHGMLAVFYPTHSVEMAHEMMLALYNPH